MTLVVPHQLPYPAWAWSFSGQSFKSFLCTNFYFSQLADNPVYACFPFPHTYLFSDEDIDVGALLKSWLRAQPEECFGNLENWLGDYFQQALDWVLKQVTFFLLDFHTNSQNGADMNFHAHNGNGGRITDLCIRWTVHYNTFADTVSGMKSQNKLLTNQEE